MSFFSDFYYQFSNLFKSSGIKGFILFFILFIVSVSIYNFYKCIKEINDNGDSNE